MGQKDRRFEGILEHWADKPGYWRVDGKPVIFVYRRTFTQVRRWHEWQRVLSRVREKWDALSIADSSSLEAFQLFDGFHITTSVLQVLMGDDLGPSTG